MNIITNFLKKKLDAFLFKNSTYYWEKRYKKGGNSGAGSYNKLAEFKADVINNIVNSEKIDTVIEFGCGDGNQLKYFKIKKYIGFDVSKVIIEKCKSYFSNDESKFFYNLNEYQNQKADMTLSLDVIYHLVEDHIFNDYMYKLFNSALKIVVVYSSNKDNHENNFQSLHVRHREFTNWVANNRKDFVLDKFIPNKYPFNGENEESSYADFYIFKKID